MKKSMQNNKMTSNVQGNIVSIRLHIAITIVSVLFLLSNAYGYDNNNNNHNCNNFGSSYTYYTQSVTIDCKNVTYGDTNDAQQQQQQQPQQPPQQPSVRRVPTDVVLPSLSLAFISQEDFNNRETIQNTNNRLQSMSSFNVHDSRDETKNIRILGQQQQQPQNLQNSINYKNNINNNGYWYAVFDSDNNKSNINVANDYDSSDEDDDDDGHSSMLSTNFVSRKNRISTVAIDVNNYNSNHATYQLSSTTLYSSPTRTISYVNQKHSNNVIAMQLLRRLSKGSTTNGQTLYERRNKTRYHNCLSIRGGGVSTTTQHSSKRSLKLVVQQQPQQQQQQTSTNRSDIVKKLIVTAIVTLLFEGMIGHILEFLKIAMQTSSSVESISYYSVIHSITKSKGIIGLWDGFIPWGVIQSLTKGAVFGLAYNTCQKLLQPSINNNIISKNIVETICGGIGGGFQGYILSPTLLLKTRVMTNTIFRTKMSLYKTTVLSFQIGYNVIRDEGIVALLKGSNVFALKRIFDWSTRYYFSDICEILLLSIKRSIIVPSLSSSSKSMIITKTKTKEQQQQQQQSIKNIQLTVTEKSIASLIGGCISTFCTLPLDVLVAKTQDAKRANVQVNALQLFINEYNTLGYIGLSNLYLRGFEARLLHVCLTTVVIKTLTPFVYELLFGV